MPRPLRTWQVAGTELLAGTTCVKLTGAQQSEHWASPRADDVAWRRKDTVWLAPRLGIAQKIERVIERRRLQDEIEWLGEAAGESRRDGRHKIAGCDGGDGRGNRWT